METGKPITLNLTKIQHDLNLLNQRIKRQVIKMKEHWGQISQDIAEEIRTGLHSKNDNTNNQASGRQLHEPTLPIDALHDVEHWQHIFSFLADQALPRISRSNRFFNTIIHRPGHPSLKRLRNYATAQRITDPIRQEQAIRDFQDTLSEESVVINIITPGIFSSVPRHQPVIKPSIYALKHEGEVGKNNGFTCSDPGLKIISNNAIYRVGNVRSYIIYGI